jgi:hypothetical protein
VTALTASVRVTLLTSPATTANVSAAAYSTHPVFEPASVALENTALPQ